AAGGPDREAERRSGPSPRRMTARSARSSRCRRRVASATQPETLDQRAVAVDVDVLQVSQQPATLTHEQQQATTRVVVVLVLLQVLGEVLDAAGQHGDLHFRGPGVTGVGC